jgi:hypothetical protein
LKHGASKKYRANKDLQRWINIHLGMIDYDNPYTGSQSVISIWQISKVIPPDILPSVRIESLLGNIAEMIDKGLLKELGDPILTTDNDSRRFSLTSAGMIQFRKEILPMAQMLIDEDQRLTQTIEKSKTKSKVKRGFIAKLNRFKEKFQEKLEDQAIDYIIGTAKDYGPKAIPILIELIRSH